MPDIALNNATIEERATALSTASGRFEGRTLSPLDRISTISANQNIQKTFQETQRGHGRFGSVLEASSVLITEIGNAFRNADVVSSGRFNTPLIS